MRNAKRVWRAEPRAGYNLVITIGGGYVHVMHIVVRKMGNSAGMILPRTILGEAGLGVGAALDVKVEEGRIVATPVRRTPRTGWAEDAERIAAAPLPDEEDDWMVFGNEGDDALTW